ncbi:MAG: hypothetical protein WC734_01695 [Patescibacteria group bacterium]|jgi:hypothetical protein
MLKKTLLVAIALVAFVFVAGCGKPDATDGDAVPASGTTNRSGTASGNVTDRTDYVIYEDTTTPAPIPGGITTHQFILGHPIPEASVIKSNAYFVPWRVDFSQVLRAPQMMPGSGCVTVKEQVTYIDGWIDLNLADMEIGPNDLPNDGPAIPSGTVHEKVTGTPGTWTCGSSMLTTAANQGSVDYINSIVGEHTANFKDASNLTGLSTAGANIYLDLSMPEDIQFIWPAGTKIEYAPEGTPIPLEPLVSSKL